MNHVRHDVRVRTGVAGKLAKLVGALLMTSAVAIITGVAVLDGPPPPWVGVYAIAAIPVGLIVFVVGRCFD